MISLNQDAVIPNILNLNHSIKAKVFWISFFTILTAIGAQIEVPNHPIPFTLQTFFVLLAGAFLGSTNGAISLAVYLFAGMLGLPVFSHGGFGIAKLFGITGGYLLSFPIAAFVVGSLIQKYNNFIWICVSMFVGMIIIFSFGTLYLNMVMVHNLKQAFFSGFLIFSWWDVLKIFSAAAIYYEFSKRITKQN
ncbi:MAG: biotin transporter BioY [Bacteroidetes bacterium]|nr:biotin transporter BioY [Bacteroidota bacterium]